MVQGTKTVKYENNFNSNTVAQLKNLTPMPKIESFLLYKQAIVDVEKQKTLKAYYEDRERMTMVTNMKTKQSYKPYLCKGQIVFINILTGDVNLLKEIV